MQQRGAAGNRGLVALAMLHQTNSLGCRRCGRWRGAFTLREHGALGLLLVERAGVAIAGSPARAAAPPTERTAAAPVAPASPARSLAGNGQARVRAGVEPGHQGLAGGLVGVLRHGRRSPSLPTLKVIHEPIPIAGSSSPVAGMGRSRGCAAATRFLPSNAATPAPAAAPSTTRRSSSALRRSIAPPAAHGRPQ